MSNDAGPSDKSNRVPHYGDVPVPDIVRRCLRRGGAWSRIVLDLLERVAELEDERHAQCAARKEPVDGAEAQNGQAAQD